jgi:hypothetical protein
MILIYDRMCLPVQDYSITKSRRSHRQQTAGFGKRTAAIISRMNLNEVDLRLAIKNCGPDS